MDDTFGSVSGGQDDAEFPQADEPRMDAPPSINLDERRMHVRAYNCWVSLLKGRACPSVEDLDSALLEDFGPNSVLLDFSRGSEDVSIAWLGQKLREEADSESEILSLADVPSWSLLSRLTDQCVEVMANRAPVGFEAEYVNRAGTTIMYRGIMMPFTGASEAIDYIYGVINWKEVADADVPADIRDAVNAALSLAASPSTDRPPVWADGPGTAVDEPEHDPLGAGWADDDELASDLGQRLELARQSVIDWDRAHDRSRLTLYRALSQAYDFALAAEAEPETYAGLLADAGIKAQARAPMTPVAKLVFGPDHDRTRLAEYAAVLAHARRHDIAAGGLHHFISETEGGIKAMVRAERDCRRTVPLVEPGSAVRARLAQAPALGQVALDGVEADYVTLIGRRQPDGSIDIINVAVLPDDQLARIGKTLQS